MKWDRRLRQWLGGGSVSQAGTIFHAQTAAFERAQLIVRFYYAALLYFAVDLLPEWRGMLGRNAPASLWPVAWIGYVNLRTGIAIVLVLFLGGAVLAAMLPGKRWARGLAFLGLFEFAAWNNSYGKIGHSLHAWVLTSALLIFLPDVAGWGKLATRLTRQKFLAVFWSCQALVLLLYSMAGLGKLAGAIYQMAIGQTNAFMPGALAATACGPFVGNQSLAACWGRG